MSDSDSDESNDVQFSMRQITAQQEESLLSSGQKRNKSELNEKSWGQGKTSRYPKSVFLILGTEFCERFNYYGMRTILVIYLTEWLGQGYDSAVALFHLFSMLAYFSPVLGAIIADGYLGRYRTILYISLIYAAGTLVLSLTAFPPPEMYGPIAGLLLISVGTGGIKPCVTAFGGDQFSSGQEKERISFFSAFYFMINLGSMLSTFITPMLRADVHCIEDSCYPLAFGVPTILMLTSLVIFVSGRNHYKHVPPTGNLFGRVLRCVWHGAKLRLKHGKKRGDGVHWMDYATDKYEESFVSDVKALLNVLWLFLPLPLFWALFDQQGSRWTLQAVEMNGDVGKLGRLKPDQMQVLNPILILVMIPLFDRLIYPCLDRIRVPNRPLQRICVGMALCSAAFVIAGFVQIKIENGKESPLDGQSGITFMNAARCKANVESKFYTGSLSELEVSTLKRVPPGDYPVNVTCQGNSSIPDLEITRQISVDGEEAYRVVIYSEDTDKLSVVMFSDMREHDTDGKALVSLVAAFPLDYPVANLSVSAREYSDGEASPETALEVNVHIGNSTEFFTVEPGRYQFFVDDKSTDAVMKFGSGSIQTVVLTPGQGNDTLPVLADANIEGAQFVSVQENQVSMLWLVPQYVVITCGEILFSITGLSFAYSQAPASMKSVLQAAWLMTVALGDLIVIIVAEARLMPSQSSEFFMFACLMGVDMAVFVVMAYFYTYVPSEAEDYTGGAGSGGLDDTTTLVDAVADDNGPDVRADKVEPHRGAKRD